MGIRKSLPTVFSASVKSSPSAWWLHSVPHFLGIVEGLSHLAVCSHLAGGYCLQSRHDFTARLTAHHGNTYIPIWGPKMLLISVLVCPLWPPMMAEGQADAAETASAVLVNPAALWVSRPFIRLAMLYRFTDFSVITPKMYRRPRKRGSPVPSLQKFRSHCSAKLIP